MSYEVSMKQLNTPRGAESCNVNKKKKARGGIYPYCAIVDRHNTLPQ